VLSTMDWVGDKEAKGNLVLATMNMVEPRFRVQGRSEAPDAYSRRYVGVLFRGQWCFVVGEGKHGVMTDMATDEISSITCAKNTS